tara:strand:- start:80 stop:517 length:438 start_codon:yes stop_codon:yes gene_type:complete
MAEVIITQKDIINEEGQHRYDGNYKGNEYKVRVDDKNDEKWVVYLEGEDKFSDEDKLVISEQLIDMTYSSKHRDGVDGDKVYVENHYEAWWSFTYDVRGTVDGKEFMMEWTEDDNSNDSDIKVGEELFEGEDDIWEEFGDAMDEY